MKPEHIYLSLLKRPSLKFNRWKIHFDENQKTKFSLVKALWGLDSIEQTYAHSFPPWQTLLSFCVWYSSCLPQFLYSLLSFASHFCFTYADVSFLIPYVIPFDNSISCLSLCPIDHVCFHLYASCVLLYVAASTDVPVLSFLFLNLFSPPPLSLYIFYYVANLPFSDYTYSLLKQVLTTLQLFPSVRPCLAKFRHFGTILKAIGNFWGFI